MSSDQFTGYPGYYGAQLPERGNVLHASGPSMSDLQKAGYAVVGNTGPSDEKRYEALRLACEAARSCDDDALSVVYRAKVYFEFLSGIDHGNP